MQNAEDGSLSSTSSGEAHLGRMQTLQNALGHVEARLDPFLSRPRGEVMGELTGVEKANLNVALAYTMSSLFYVLLKTKGAPTEDHEVRTELQRISKAVQQVKSATSTGGAAVVDGGQRRVRVDPVAGRRVIQHALSGTEEQQPGKGRKRSAADGKSDGSPRKLKKWEGKGTGGNR